MHIFKDTHKLAELLERLEDFDQFTQWKIKQMGLRNYVDAGDIHQDVAISVSRRQSSEPINNLNSYLKTCIMRQLLKCKKKVEKELRSSLPVESIPDNVPEPQENDVYTKIRYLMTELNERERKIMEYAFFEGLKAPEIAKKLSAEGYNITSNNIRQIKKRALDKLREKF